MLVLSLLLLAAPQPLDLIWNVSPSPHSKYVACGGNTTFCVTPGEWWGICRAEQFGASKKTLAAGTLSLNAGEAHHTGCEFYQALFAKSVKLGGDPAKAAFADPGCRTSLGDAKIDLSPMGTKTIAVKSNADGTLQVAELPSRVSSCDGVKSITGWSTAIAITWDGPSLPLEKTWDVEVIGDLDQDGAVELIVAKQSTRGQDTVAFLGTVRGATFEKLATTVNNPKLPVTPEAKQVQGVQDAHDECEHWAGEHSGDGDKKHEARVAAGANKACGAFKKKLAAALKKYPENATLKELAKSELAL